MDGAEGGVSELLRIRRPEQLRSHLRRNTVGGNQRGGRLSTARRFKLNKLARIAEVYQPAIGNEIHVRTAATVDQNLMQIGAVDDGIWLAVTRFHPFAHRYPEQDIRRARVTDL